MSIKANELKIKVLKELELRACQERMVSRIGRTTKASRDAHEHAAKALEVLATYIKTIEVENV